MNALASKDFSKKGNYNQTKINVLLPKWQSATKNKAPFSTNQQHKQLTKPSEFFDHFL